MVNPTSAPPVGAAQPSAARRAVLPGGLAVALGLPPFRSFLNAANPHLSHFYRWVKRGLIIQIAMKKQESAFYDHWTRFNQLLDERHESSAEAAALFYYLNRTGYNGLCRFN